MAKANEESNHQQPRDGAESATSLPPTCASSSANKEMAFSNAFLGYSIVLFGVLVLSLDALMIDEVKSRGLDDWSLLFYRYLLSTSTIFFFMNLFDGGPLNMPAKFERIGYTGLFASCFWAIASITYTLAIEHTHVANVMIIMATTSLWTALFSSFIFYEILPLRLVIAIVVSFLAVAIVVGLSMTLDEDWEGNLCALMSALSMALFFVTIRSVNAARKDDEKIDMGPCNVVAGTIVVFVSGMVCIGFQVDLGAVTDDEWLYLALQGIVILAIGNTCLTAATRYLAATEVTIIMLLDTILEPVWVWLAGLDTPPLYSLYAGIVVVLALGVNATLALLEEAEAAAKTDDDGVSGSGGSSSDGGGSSGSGSSRGGGGSSRGDGSSSRGDGGSSRGGGDGEGGKDSVSEPLLSKR